MREMKDSGIDWVEQIPVVWSVMPNKHIMKKTKEICSAYSGQDILSLTMNGVIVRDLENPTGKMPATFDGYQVVHKGNLLMCLFDIDVTPRCIGLIENEGLVSPAYSQFVLKDNAYAKFYYYYYLMMDNSKELLHLAKNLRHSFTEEQLGAILVPVPPKSQQIKIANLLDKKLLDIEMLTRNVQTQIEKLKSYKQSLITEVVTKGLDPTVPMKDSGVEWIGEIPKEWKVSKIKYICEFNPTKKKELSPKDIVSYAPMDCIRAGNFNCKEFGVSDVSSGLTYFEKYDILMAKVTPCFENGNIVIADNMTKEIGFGSSELFVFRTSKNIRKWLFYFLQNDIFKKYATATMTGTGGLKRVSPNFVKNYSLAVPSEAEQQQIVAYLDEKCAQIDRLLEIKQKKIEKLNEYKKSLIYEYVTGKREV